MSGDRASWLALNQPYPGAAEALRDCPFPFYIASSKAGHRVSALLRELLGIDIPEGSPRLFASLLPPEEKKAEALRAIERRPAASDPATRLHFVDDRLETLRAVRAAGDLGRWSLHLADYGYAAPGEVEAARAEGFSVLGLRSFTELLRWGLVQGVDDGCEPTREEVDASVA